MDESNLIQAAQGGDVRSFNELVHKYQKLVYHTAFRILGNGETAEDVTQDAFISAYNKLGSYRGGSFKSWLLRIATNLCYDHLRAMHRHVITRLEPDIIDSLNATPIWPIQTIEGPEEYAERQELHALLEKGLMSLSLEHRTALVLADIDGVSYQEIAEITGTNIGTIKSRLSRARSQLRDFLGASDLLSRQYTHSAEQKASATTW